MDTDVIVGGAPLRRFEDDVCRYCGLPWSGGEPEIWAYPFYDELPAGHPDTLDNADLVAVSAVHPGISKADLEWFVDARSALEDLLRALDSTIDLADSDHQQQTTLNDLLDLAPGRLALATRLLHRKRPRLVPLFGRHLTDRYRHDLDGKGETAWPDLIPLLADDLAADTNRSTIAALFQRLQPELDVVPSPLRLVDIAVWMEAR